MTESTSRPALHRRTLLIDRDFQLKYAGLLGVAGLIISAAFALMAYLVHADAEKSAALLTGTAERPIDPLLVLLLAVAVLIGTGAMALVGLVLTHRVAGPVYVMTHYMSALASGRYLAVRPLRKNDELQGFFARFQSALETLRAREAEEAAALEEALASITRAPRSPELDVAVARLSALHQRKRSAIENSAQPRAAAV